MLTERQLEKTTIGIWAAGGITTFLILQAVGLTFWLAGIASSVETVQQNQREGQIRAEQRQEETEGRIDDVVSIGRDRNLALDARIRPLETQAAAAAATLQSINSNLLQLGADVRDLRQAFRDSPEDEKP